MYGSAPLRDGPFRADDQDLRLGHVSQRQPGRQCLAKSCHVAEQKPGTPCFASCQDRLACLDLMRSRNEDARASLAGGFGTVSAMSPKAGKIAGKERLDAAAHQR